MMDKHLTNEQLQMVLDDALSAGEAEVARKHLLACSRCHSAFESLRAVDRALGALPLEHTSPGFTRNVLEKLNIAPRSSFLFRIVENLAYVFGLMIVLGVMLAIFVVTGVIDTEQLSTTQNILGGTSEVIGERMGTVIESFVAALRSYVPFLFGGGSLKIAAIALLTLGMLALVDRAMNRRYR